MSGFTVDQALEVWQEDGLLSKEQIKNLKAGLKKYEPRHVASRGITIFATIGAILVGLGVILFVGSNWDNMPPFLRIAVLFLAYGLSIGSAWMLEQRGYNLIAESLWFLSTLIFGANIFLLAQIYNYSLTYWQGPFWWLVGAVAMGYAREKKAYGILAVPLILFTIGWLGGGKGWFTDDQFEFIAGHSGLSPLFPALGISFICLGLLSRKLPIWSTLTRSWLVWGSLLFAIPLVITTFDGWMYREIFTATFTMKQDFILVFTLVIACLAAWYADFRSPVVRIVLVTLAAFSLLILLPSWLVSVDSSSQYFSYLRMEGWRFAMYVAAVFCLSLASVWAGVLSQNESIINLGVAAVTIIIAGQYFTWTFALLDRSIAFILGGALIIVLSIVIETMRRRLITHSRHAS